MKSAFIYKRNTIYFFTSFIWTATLSVLPQVFFMTYYPEHKNTFLSLFLLLGTLASVAGILTSQNNKFYSSLTATAQRRNLVTASCIFATAVTFSGLFLVRNLSLYFACFILMKFISNLFYNWIDRLFVARSDREQLEIHVRSNLIFQLLGIMIAPLYFSVYISNTTTNLVLIWTMAILSMVLLMITDDGKKVSPNYRKNDPLFPQEKLSLYHRLFVAYSILILTSVTMLISMMIYILKDYYKFDNPAAKGGTIIGVISAFAVITVLMSGVLSTPQIKLQNKVSSHQVFSPWPNGIALFVLILTTLAFYLKISSSFYILLCLCSFAGISYGIFLFYTRNYASSASKNPGLISVYNNLPNYASLAGYLLTLPVSFVAKTKALDFSRLMLGIILAFFVLSFLTLYLISIKNQSFEEKGGGGRDC